MRKYKKNLYIMISLTSFKIITLYITANFDVNSRKNFIGEDKILRIYILYIFCDEKINKFIIISYNYLL